MTLPVHALQHRRTHPLKQIQTLPIRTEKYTERKISFTTFIFFVSILSLVRTLFLILRDLKIMNVILVFTIVP